MAKSISISSGSLLIGNPIAVSVVSETVGQLATFHRVRLIVSAALSTDGQRQTFELSAPAGDSETVVFDISTALRSATAGYRYTPVTADTTYPYIAYSLTAYDEYMLNGILTEKEGECKYNNGADSYALFGAFTDMERYLAGDTKAVTTFTRKPSTGEVCASGEVIIYPGVPSAPLEQHTKISEGPKVFVQSLAGMEGKKTYGGRTIYVDPEATDRMLFQFVNGYGVVETISAETMEDVHSTGATEVDIRTAPSAFGSPAGKSVRRSNRQLVYHCSTGYVNKEWAQWWLDEFLGGDNFRRNAHSRCWVRIDGHWLPCVIIPEDDITVYERSKSGLISIPFEVRIF